MPQLKPIVLSLALFLGLVNASPAFSFDGKPTIEALVKAFKQWTATSSDNTISKAAVKYIDYQYMAERAIGQANWQKLSVSERRDYVRDFRNLIESRYYPRWHKIFSKGNITYGAQTGSGNEGKISTRVLVGQSAEQIDWSVVDRGDFVKVVNLSVNGKDLLRRISGRFQSKYKRAGFAKFTAWMRGQIKGGATPAAGGAD